MREFLILIMVVVFLIYLGPIIMGFLIFSLCVAAIVILLAKLGFLPGFRYVRYGGGTRGDKSSWKWKWKYPGRENRNERGGESRSESGRDSGGGWYQASQEGEEVTLPETALRKENEQK